MKKHKIASKEPSATLLCCSAPRRGEAKTGAISITRAHNRRTITLWRYLSPLSCNQARIQNLRNMTTSSFNPLQYLKQAWSKTHSAWGKAAIVLFYSFVWVEIIWGVQIMIAPLVVFPCFNAHASDSEIVLAGSLLRQLNLFAIGLLLYADRGGIALWNVGSVLTIFAINTCLFCAMMIPYDTLDNFVACHDEHQALVTIKFAFLVWITAAFICSLDEASKTIVDNATAATADAPETMATTTAPPFNHIYYIKQAWHSSNSTWGKLSTVLFYTWVWSLIIMSSTAVVVPMLGMPCLHQHFDQGDVLMARTYLREYNIYAIGFLLYAGRGGTRIWNVSMVLIFYVISIVLFVRQFVPQLRELDQFASCGDDLAAFKSGTWTTVAWLVVALLTSFVDALMVTTGTADETAPINV